MSTSEELGRCDRELQAIDARADIDDFPAYLSVMGRNDWEHERRLILAEGASIQSYLCVTMRFSAPKTT